MDANEPARQASAALEAWLVASLPWLGAALLLAACAVAVGVFLVLRRLGELERLGGRLDALEQIRSAVARFVDQRADLDLRRIEHALLELRDGQKRLEGLLVATLERSRAAGLGAAPAAVGSSGVADRVIDRLLVLGYERIQLVTPLEELEPRRREGGEGRDEGAGLGLPEDDDLVEVLVEAHRNGVLCKGRARLARGVLVDVDMKPAYTAFP